MQKENLRLVVMTSCLIIILAGFAQLRSPTTAVIAQIGESNQASGLWVYAALITIILAIAGYRLSNSIDYSKITGGSWLNKELNTANTAIDAMNYPEAYDAYMRITTRNIPENKRTQVDDVYYKLLLFDYLNQMQTAAINGHKRALQDHILTISDLLNRINDKKGQLYSMGVYHLQYYSCATPRKNNFGKLREMGRR